MTQPTQAVLTLPEVAEWLGVHPNTIHRAARAGRIPARRVGREWRFLTDAVAIGWSPRRRGTPEAPMTTAPAPRVPAAPLELTAQQAADYLRVGLETVYVEVKAERLPAWKEGGELRTTEGALRDYLAFDPEAGTRYAKPRGRPD
ncbi:MAG: helix-turn-helix domain-containing protein [Thermoleophilia bacterium]